MQCYSATKLVYKFCAKDEDWISVTENENHSEISDSIVLLQLWFWNSILEVKLHSCDVQRWLESSWRCSVVSGNNVSLLSLTQKTWVNLARYCVLQYIHMWSDQVPDRAYDTTLWSFLVILSECIFFNALHNFVCQFLIAIDANWYPCKLAFCWRAMYC